ncbi:hypothetical protein O181_008702 [Austropuccinia psidii MF-1]|uniref:Uncharacterized protein n=1 Tax=Austropuccinia psidii MF-1 TaxID=1389203 RepID=A0A9Q3GJM3_9BASI|nr:hypothetical protein [Austropuccinia psidii MF-1]
MNSNLSSLFMGSQTNLAEMRYCFWIFQNLIQDPTWNLTFGSQPAITLRIGNKLVTSISKSGLNIGLYPYPYILKAS